MGSSIWGGIKDACYNYGKKTAGYIVKENKTLCDMTKEATLDTVIPAQEFPNIAGAFSWGKLESAGLGALNGITTAASGALDAAVGVVETSTGALGKVVSSMGKRGDLVADDAYKIFGKVNKGIEKTAARVGSAFEKTGGNLEKNAINVAKDKVKSALGQ